MRFKKEDSPRCTLSQWGSMDNKSLSSQKAKKVGTYNNVSGGTESKGCHEAYPDQLGGRHLPASWKCLTCREIFIAHEASFHSWLTLSTGRSFQLGSGVRF